MDHLMRRLLAVSMTVCALTFCYDAKANSCQNDLISKQSIHDLARIILDKSDFVGFVSLQSEESTVSVKQQMLKSVNSVKGTDRILRVSPKTYGRVTRHDGLIRWFYWKPDEVRLVALIKTEDGYAMPTCSAAAIASRPADALFNAFSKAAK